MSGGRLGLLIGSVLTAAAGTLLGLAFALPALGLNVYGGNRTEVTLVALGIATALYVGGAIGEVVGGRHLAQHAQRSPKPFLWAVAAYVAFGGAFGILWPPIHGDWEGGLLVLICDAAIVAPIAIGWLSIRVVPVAPRLFWH